jgi:hypothetical protein
MKKEELKACPFCGSMPMRLVRTNNYGKGYGSVKYVVGFGCVNIECPVKPQIDANDENIVDKVELFNRRTP